MDEHFTHQICVFQEVGLSISEGIPKFFCDLLFLMGYENCRISSESDAQESDECMVW